MIHLDEYSPLEESFKKGKKQFWKALWLVIKGMFKWKRFVFVYTDLESGDKDYNLHIYWYGLNADGVKKALIDVLMAEAKLDDTLDAAKKIINNEEED